jgi:Mce-associated membrane protein
MAEHAGTTGLAHSTNGGESEIVDEETTSEADAVGDESSVGEQNATDGPESSNAIADVSTGRTWWQRLKSPIGAVSVCAIAVVALSAVAGVLGHRIYEERQARTERDMFVEAARQGVINLTTIGYPTIDADIARVLNSTTGGFHDDFQKRSQPFAQVVKQAQTKSEGTITSAAMQTRDGDQAEVMVTVSLKMTNLGAPEQAPQSWRMLIKVERSGDSAKVSNVQFAT